MGPLQCGIHDWDHIQTDEWITLFWHFICFLLESGLLMSLTENNENISGIWLLSAASVGYLSLCNPPPAPHLWAVTCPGHPSPGQGSAQMLGLALLDLPGFQVRSWATPRGHQSVHQLRCTDCTEKCTERFLHGFPLKRHHSLITLGPVSCIAADRYCTLMLMQSCITCCSCQFSIRDCWTCLVRILNTGLSPL